jgi:L-xylulokinase
VKAALYDERGEERAVAGATMAPLNPAPGCLECDPEAMWSAICEVARKVLKAAAVAPSSIVAVGLTGYGNGLYLVDRQGRPVRNGVLSPDLRAQEIVARWRAAGLEDRTIPLTYQRQWPGKLVPLIAWLETHEPAGPCHVAESSSRKACASESFKLPRLPRATCSSPRREACDVSEPR